MLCTIGCGQHRRHGERCWYRRDGYMAREASLQRINLLSHGTGIADDSARPFQDPFALGSESTETGTPSHQQYTKHIFELLYAAGERRLTDTDGLRGASKMLLPCQGDDEFQLIDHGRLFAALHGELSNVSHLPPRRQLAGLLIRLSDRTI